MPRTREIARQRARAYRAAKAKTVEEEEIARRAQLSHVLGIVRAIVADPAFIELALREKADKIPDRLRSEGMTTIFGSQEADAPFEFVVAWKYLFPVLGQGAMRTYFDTNWPGFVEQFKDAFIGLVMKGPFLGERRPTLSRGLFN
ncbi:hypothetical protein SAMN03159423_4844 [Bradyrhizobium sp. NFR13]|uniref:hypothetical protein n=1 Tax=Bradyrhizobium sp. NFR13 TaxID=1566285 RepID=UPI0008E38291|nr:hypothetical protein [Bradyrhizobium sp. NFR13]SFM00308.1 hypothetical protein SAMN03159423_4844 [Bradyrhizobium sp. NFR13]